jgi:hypothetical protein
MLKNTSPPELIKVFATLCVNIQKEFDISVTALNTLLNNNEFVRQSCFLYDQFHTEMTNHIIDFKETFTGNEDSITSDEYEKCGFLIRSHQNTYVSYCNAHKYLHPHPDIKTTSNSDITHPFVMKNTNQIIKEKYDTTIHQAYQSFVNKLYSMVLLLFMEMIDDQCQKSTTKTTPDDLSSIIHQMESDDLVFKSKSIYEYIDTNTPRTDVDVGIPNKFYYVKVYKLNT